MNFNSLKIFFLSIFDFIFDIFFPYSMEKKLEIVDKIFKKNFKYKKEKIKQNTSLVENFLEDMIKNFPSDAFHPYAYYNQDMDKIEIYFNDKSCHTEPVNQQIEFHKCFESNEIVGVNILNIKKLIE